MERETMSKVSAGRVLLLPKGKYQDEGTYTLLDMVSDEGIAYVSRKTSKGIKPKTDINEEYWMKLGSEGSPEDVQDTFDYVFGLEGA